MSAKAICDVIQATAVLVEELPRGATFTRRQRQAAQVAAAALRILAGYLAKELVSWGKARGAK